MKQCGCEYGEDCTRTSVCANNSQVEDLEEKIEQLEAQVEALQNKCARRGLSPEDSDALIEQIGRLESELSKASECNNPNDLWDWLCSLDATIIKGDKYGNIE